jgi:hypothetical protein
MDVIKQAEDFIRANPEKTVKPAKPAIKTITCIKGKTTKKVSGITPKCPVGYKKK